MVGFIGFIIVMAVLSNILEGIDSSNFWTYVSAFIALFSSYNFTKKNLAKWKKTKDADKLEEQKEALRKEIAEEKQKIASIEDAQQYAPEEPYYPEVKYFNK